MGDEIDTQGGKDDQRYEDHQGQVHPVPPGHRAPGGEHIGKGQDDQHRVEPGCLVGVRPQSQKKAGRYEMPGGPGAQRPPQKIESERRHQRYQNGAHAKATPIEVPVGEGQRQRGDQPAVAPQGILFSREQLFRQQENGRHGSDAHPGRDNVHGIGGRAKKGDVQRNEIAEQDFAAEIGRQKDRPLAIQDPQCINAIVGRIVAIAGGDAVDLGQAEKGGQQDNAQQGDKLDPAVTAIGCGR